MSIGRTALLGLVFATLPVGLAAQHNAAPPGEDAHGYCRDWQPERFTRNPTRAELHCRYGITGPGRFGLLSYADVPVYQPATPMPGTHLAGVPGHARPWANESYEAWEWRVLRTEFGPEARVVHRDLSLLDPLVAGEIMAFERQLAEEQIRATRRESWRSHTRQAFLFQQGRSRPGAIATATLTSWHGQLDARGNPAGRAVDYSVHHSDMERFHEIAAEIGLLTFGADSNDPGHVFRPDAEALPRVEIEMLRLLPRVPEVTIATGLPVDRPLPIGGRAALQEAVARFVQAPFIPILAVRRSAPPVPPRLLLHARPHTASGLAAADGETFSDQPDR